MSTPTSPTAHHTRARDARALEAEALDGTIRSVGVVSLVFFGGAAIALGVAWFESETWLYIAGAVLATLFALSFIGSIRLERRRDRALVRKDINARQLARIELKLDGLDGGLDLMPPRHPYASDLDIFGGRSVFARIAVAHTEKGRRVLANWLLEPATPETTRERQVAVRELAARREIREDLEAAVLETGSAVLDGRPFLAFVDRPAAVLGLAWLRPALWLLPILFVVLFALSGSVLPRGVWVVALIINMVLVGRFQAVTTEVHHLLAGRSRFVESYRTLIEVVEKAPFEAPLLKNLQAELRSSGELASKELRSLETWASLFELRQQGLVYLFINFAVLWDLQILLRLEAWAKRGRTACSAWFDAIGAVEALASLSVLLDQDSDAIVPDVHAASEGRYLDASSLSHPLLQRDTRVPNDVALEGPGSALVITGSNMAGKSTLLRAIGVNVVVALAGGPVIAKSFSVAPMRTRASMRIADSLQESSSYFHAELERLRIVVADAEASPPVLFLLDELLRGTNARARHLGARAVLLHLLKRGALGLVATHDIALSELEEEMPGKVHNVHFTDVIEGGEMRFDYKLRDGVVKTSNALLLLQQAGIEVEADTSLTALR